MLLLRPQRTGPGTKSSILWSTNATESNTWIKVTLKGLGVDKPERSSIINLFLRSWHMTHVEWKKIDVIFSYHQRMFEFGGTIKILVDMSHFIGREGLTGETDLLKVQSKWVAESELELSSDPQTWCKCIRTFMCFFLQKADYTVFHSSWDVIFNCPRKIARWFIISPPPSQIWMPYPPPLPPHASPMTWGTVLFLLNNTIWLIMGWNYLTISSINCFVNRISCRQVSEVWVKRRGDLGRKTHKR